MKKYEIVYVGDVPIGIGETVSDGLVSVHRMLCNSILPHEDSDEKEADALKRIKCDMEFLLQCIHTAQSRELPPKRKPRVRK